MLPVQGEPVDTVSAKLPEGTTGSVIEVEEWGDFVRGCKVVVHSKKRLEVREVAAVDGRSKTITLDEPLANKYETKGEGEGADTGGFITQCADDQNYGLSKLELAIKHERNKMYTAGRRGRCLSGKIYQTVLFQRILDPMLAHGSAAIYAPDLTIEKVCGMLTSYASTESPAPEGASLKDRALTSAKEWIKTHKLLCVAVFAAGVLFMLKSKALTCFFKRAFIGWAIYNQGLGPGMRFLSISGMMILRLAVSNVLPFTSPAFAFLIATSQPPGEDYMGVIYLLACSMPAGLVVPLLDWLVYWAQAPWRAREQVDRYYDFKKGAHQFDHHFACTNLCTKMTDYLPFSFWVRPFFMQPAFSAAVQAGAEAKSASAIAVLAGHFMIWAGPATSMYQRLFVPDWVTCCFIQPLGLLEDVAVVLAAWAGSASQNEKPAEISLYMFMMYMNFVTLITFRMAHGPATMRDFTQHLIVGLLTMAAVGVRTSLDHDQSVPNWLLSLGSSTTQTTTTPAAAVEEACGPAVHSNVKVAGVLLLWVSCLALVFRIVARALTCDRNKDADRPRPQQVDNHMSKYDTILLRIILLFSAAVPLWMTAITLGKDG